MTGTVTPASQREPAHAVAESELRRFASAMIGAAGTPDDLARLVGDSLVDANLAGHDSHGVLRLTGYLRAVQTGDVRPAARPTVLGRDRATARLDGAYGWGQPGMLLAATTAIDLAREHGVGAAVVQRSYHIGRVAPYVEAVARAGMVGLAMTNAGPAVAPHQGRQRVLGTNPIAWAMPRGNGGVLSYDGATSVIPEGKLLAARARGELVRPGLLIDAEGRPSTDPADFYAGGALLPFGGYKGYAFSVLAQMLGRGLAGMDTTGFDGPRGANGPVILALDIGAFTTLDQFAAEIEAQCAVITGSAPAVGETEVLLPGEIELRRAHERRRDGVPLPAATWQALRELADAWHVPALS